MLRQVCSLLIIFSICCFVQNRSMDQISFGCKDASPSTGLVLNNHIRNYDYDGKVPGWEFPANVLSPGKRHLTTMDPALIVDQSGDAKLVVGASGGSRIPTSTSWVSTPVSLPPGENWGGDSGGKGVSKLQSKRGRKRRWQMRIRTTLHWAVPHRITLPR